MWYLLVNWAILIKVATSIRHASGKNLEDIFIFQGLGAEVTVKVIGNPFTASKYKIFQHSCFD